MDRLAARIAFGVLTLTTVGAPLSLSAGAGAATPAGIAARSAITGTLPVGAPKSPAEATAATYVVRPGDGLWEIAGDHLGDGADWTTLAALNLGRDMGGGARFVDPDQLRAGWRLRLPAEARRTGEPAARADRTDHPLNPEPAGHLPELIALGLARWPAPR
jgi:Tfp pilus assembly protein FimV